MAVPNHIIEAGQALESDSSMSIVGKIECNGPAQIFGRVEGELRASELLISEGAQLEGSVIAQDVTIRGRVKGNIRADRVKLQGSGAVVEGDISYRLLSIDDDSLFEGSSRRIENPTDLSSSDGDKDPQKKHLSNPAQCPATPKLPSNESFQPADETIKAMTPKLRLLLASCTFVVIFAYAAWQNQHPTVSDLGPAEMMALDAGPGPQRAAVPHSLLDPRPAWGTAPIPQLRAALISSQEETAAEGGQKPEPEEGAATEPMAYLDSAGEAVHSTSSPQIAPVPLPRPRPRKTPAFIVPSSFMIGPPLKIN